ncbi:MAG: TRAP transporter small permease [Burkholderiales bacterium]|nr:TRAP transporter small permease [Burkholderiales bacterium]
MYRRVANWFYGLLSILTATNVFAMMALTFVDVLARYLFNAPLKGSYEVLGFMLAVLVFGSLPLITRDREHISVEIFESLANPGLERVKNSAVALCCAAILLLMGWRMWVHAGILREGQQITGYLEMPIYPVAWFISATCFASALSAIGVAFMPPEERNAP